MQPTTAQSLLRDLVGQTIPTMTGRPNVVLRLERDAVIVGTRRSPKGQPVPIDWVQDAFERLHRHGELEISVASVGYRSAFIGAVLQTVPGVVATTHPRVRRLRRG